MTEIAKQVTFDTIVNHLRAQGCRAATFNDSEYVSICKYRTEVDGRLLKCAAGCLIPDDRYKPEFEGSSLYVDYQLRSKLTTPGFLIKELGHDTDLVFQLQEVHDGVDVEFWEGAFKSVALKNGLIYTEPVNK